MKYAVGDVMNVKRPSIKITIRALKITIMIAFKTSLLVSFLHVNLSCTNFAVSYHHYCFCWSYQLVHKVFCHGLGMSLSLNRDTLILIVFFHFTYTQCRWHICVCSLLDSQVLFRFSCCSSFFTVVFFIFVVCDLNNMVGPFFQSKEHRPRGSQQQLQQRILWSKQKFW